MADDIGDDSDEDAVAALGIARNTGQKNNANAKHTAVEKAVRPVRPP